MDRGGERGRGTEMRGERERERESHRDHQLRRTDVR